MWQDGPHPTTMLGRKQAGSGKPITSAPKCPGAEVTIRETGEDTAPSRLMGGTPIAIARILGVQVPAIIDCGSQVTILSEQFYEENFGKTELKDCMLTISAANSLPIPYLGYFEADINIDGITVSKRGILVSKNSSKRAPCILGTNVLEHVPKYANVLKIPKKTPEEKRKTGFARVIQTVEIPADSYIDVSATGPSRASEMAVVEPLHVPLPGNVKLAPVLIKGSRFAVRILNLSNKPVTLPKNTQCITDLPATNLHRNAHGRWQTRNRISNSARHSKHHQSRRISRHRPAISNCPSDAT